MTVLVEKHDGIAVVTLNREKSLNAMNRQMVRDLARIWPELRADDGVRVVVVTGSGDKSFCSGTDLKEMRDSPEGWHRESFWDPPGATPLEAGLEFWKPVIGAINGFCLGAGCTLALSCDIRLASERARFGFPEVSVGVPTIVAALRLPALTSLANAAELLLVGDDIDAREAWRLGLVNRVVAHAAVMPEAMRLAERICRNAPRALQVTKEVLIRGRDLPFRDGVRLGSLLRRVAYDTEDSVEGPRAFAEKRKPRFRGR
ncbi:MAG: enoyl-CoA hydratase/isomerase family protein [Gammaproteobacteria bacterium]|nr:enoyl-CoA hydratase/isomerase family protein [Gammaproteobacteria bacterium]